MNPIALPVMTTGPGIVAEATPNVAAGADLASSLFAELLQEAVPEIESQSLPTTESGDESPKVALPRDSALPLDEVATPMHKEEKPEDDSVALAYALVVGMPVTSSSEISKPESTPAVPTNNEDARVVSSQSVAATLTSKPKSFAAVMPEASKNDEKEHTIVVEAPVLPILAPGPGPESKPAPIASKPEQIVATAASPTQIPTDPPMIEAPQTKSATPEPQGTPSQPVILEARITKKSEFSESDKPLINKEGLSSETTISDREPGRSIAPPVKEAAKAEFSTGDHESEHRDEQRANLSVRQQPVHQEGTTAPVPNVEQERLVAPRAVSHEPVPRVLSHPEIPDTGKADSGPLKSMDLRIPDANGGAVTVRLQERAGGVHVSVRSNDAQLANGVAANLPELGRNLDRQGFRAETWTPGEAQRVLDSGPEGLLRTGATREHAVDTAHAGTANPIQSEQAQPGNEHADRHRKPDWQEETYKRPRRPSDENFKEHLS